jgi:hypothetical protein
MVGRDNLWPAFFCVAVVKFDKSRLAVCRTIAEDHGGRTRAENNPDRGTTFTFELPAVENG